MMNPNKAPRVRAVAPPRIHTGVTYRQVRQLLAGSCTETPAAVYGNHPDRCVLFLPQAAAELSWITHWDQLHWDNADECQYILEGYHFSGGKDITTVVAAVIPLESALRTPDAVQAMGEDGDNTAYRLLRAREALLARNARTHNLDRARGVPLNPLVQRYGAPYQVGWGHSHQNRSVFWSAVDMGCIQAPGNGEPYVSIVVDPIRLQMLAGIGQDLQPARVELLAFPAARAAAPAGGAFRSDTSRPGGAAAAHSKDGAAAQAQPGFAPETAEARTPKFGPTPDAAASEAQPAPAPDTAEAGTPKSGPAPDAAASEAQPAPAPDTAGARTPPSPAPNPVLRRSRPDIRIEVGDLSAKIRRTHRVPAQTGEDRLLRRFCTSLRVTALLAAGLLGVLIAAGQVLATLVTLWLT